MRLEKIEVKNFQSHKNTTVELDKGLNVFMGRSDHGKSAIMKSFLAIFENKAGESFVSNWLKDEKGKFKGNAEITASFDDGGWVKRIRGKDNQYFIGTQEQSKELTAFGQSVPDIVQKYIDLSDVNIQTQENNFFLFNMSNGEVMRRINSYVNLDLIDTTLANADKSLRDNRKQTNVAQSKIDDIDEKLKVYEILPDLESSYSKAKECLNALEDAKRKLVALKAIIDRVYTIEDKLLEFKNTDKIYRKIIQTVKLEEAILENDKKINSINSIIAKYNRIKNQIFDIPKGLEESITKLLPDVKLLDEKKRDLIRLKKLITHHIELVADIVEQLPDIGRAVNISEELKMKRKHLENIKNRISEYERLENRYDSICDKLKEAEEKFHDLMPDVCPLCGAKHDKK